MIRNKLMPVVLSTIMMFSFSACRENSKQIPNPNNITTIPKHIETAASQTTQYPQPPTAKPSATPEISKNTQTDETTAEKKSIRYIGNKNSGKFHRPDCYTLPAEKNRVEFSSRDEAINSGYSPCGNCQP